MSYYRTYRPQVISEIDNNAVQKQLLDLLHKERKDLPHAYLFSGPKGAGKTTAARLIAKIFNCQKLSKKDGPCGVCEQCVTIAKGNNLDVLEIDAASNRGIDEIRSLREQIALTPAGGEYKIYIIDEVHMLTTEAFNALLKTLEEPPLHAAFVLATTELQKVPVTIQSRCMIVQFSQASKDELANALMRIVKKEKLDIEKLAVYEIAEIAGGSFRDATKLLEQLSFHRGKISADVVRKTLLLSDDKSLDQFIGFISQKNAKRAILLIGQCIEKGQDLRTFLIEFLGKLDQLLIAQVMGEGVGWSSDDLKEAIKKFSAAYVDMKLSPIVQLPLELAIVEYCGQNEKVEMSEEVEENESLGLLTTEKLTEHWPDFIASLKSYNHSVAGVLRSARPREVKNGIVTIEAFYPFHLEKLNEPKVKDVLSQTIKKLFGEKAKIEIVLGKK